MADPQDLGRRLRGVAGRTKATPSRIEWLFANQESVNEVLRQMLAAVTELASRLDQLNGDHAGDGGFGHHLIQLDQNTRAGVTAIGNEIHHLHGRLDLRLRQIDAAVAGQSGLLQRAIAEHDRGAAFGRLVEELGPAPVLQPGLSVFITCWNHAGYLPGAVGSALATLDAVDPDLAGEVLILDDASTDETPAIAAELAAAEDRVRVIRGEDNMGLSRARNALLHAAATTHALQLDADNLAEPMGVADLFDVARSTGAAFTYGTLLRQDSEGQVLGTMSNEPLAAPWFASNYIDSFAVIDLDQARSLGGFPLDPAFEPIDDWAMVHRFASAGALIGFVPVIAGRYRVLDSGLNQSAPDFRIGPGRVVRTFNSDGRLTVDSVAAFAAHPTLGPLWATPAAIAVNPRLEPAPVPRRPSGDSEQPALLVIGPGGVANLGDDAIVVAALAQIQHHAPDHRIDLITDGPDVVPLDPATVWLGTLSEAVWGLTLPDLPEKQVDPVAHAALARVPSAKWPRPTIHLGDYAGAVFVGGGSLTSLWGDTLIAPRVVLGAALRHAGVPYVMSGQGIGPLDDEDRELVVTLVGGALATSVRNRASADDLRADLRPSLTGDDALLLPGLPADELVEALELAGLDGRPYIACTVRDADYVGASGEALEAWAAAVDNVARERGEAVLGVALNDQPPAPEIETLARLAHGGARRAAPWRLITCDRDPILLAGLMAGASAVATHSYHAALFGLRADVPTVLAAANPYYEAKALGLAELAGLDPTVMTVEPANIIHIPGRLAVIADELAAGRGLTDATARVQAWWPEALALLIGARVRS